METLTALPETIAAGTTVAYTKTVADYPATDGWTLTLEIAGEKLLSVEADANGGDYDVTISAEQSATLTAGTYYFAEKVEKAGEVHRVGSGRVTVEPNLATALAGDLQSPNERMLKALNAVIVHVALPAVTLHALHGFTFDAEHLAPVLMPWMLFSIGALLFWSLGRRLGLSRGQIGALTLVGVAIIIFRRPQEGILEK